MTWESAGKWTSGGGDAWEAMNLQAHRQLLPSPSKQCSWPQWPPLALTVLGICWPQLYSTHAQSKRAHNRYVQYSCTARNPTSDLAFSHHMLLGGLGWEKSHCILGRPASVSRHTEEPQRGWTGALYASPRLWGGGHGRLRGCKGCNTSQHLSGTCLRAALRSTL